MGGKDHAVPEAVTRATLKQYRARLAMCGLPGAGGPDHSGRPHPTRRGGDPDVRWPSRLASGRAGNVTGTDVLIDGGLVKTL
jgi:hypothetical protein